MVKMYKSIFGFMDYEDLYEYVVNEQKNDGRFLEVGCFMGKSVLFLSEYVNHTKKDIEIYCIDNFEGCCHFKKEKIFNKKNLKKCFLNNTKTAPRKIKLLEGETTLKAKELIPVYFDFIFLDACHEYKCIKNDIQNFIPLVKKNGYLGGHDFNDLYPGVKSAVTEIFACQTNINKTFKNCWLHKL